MIFFIHASLYIGVEASRPITEPFLTDFAHITINQTGNLTMIGSENQTMDEYNITAGDDIVSGTGIYSFNPLSPIWGFVTFLWGMLTAPITLLALDIPWQVKLVFIAPLGVLYLLAVISFIRGTQL